MRRVLCLLTIALLPILSFGQRGQDFASRFMQLCKEDTAVHCVSISPHMMEQILKHSSNPNDDIKKIISELKSARIITTSRQGEDYYQMAEQLLEKNKNRFQRDKGYKGTHAYGCFYTRMKKSLIVELVMLHADTRNDHLVIVNLTGSIDNVLIGNLTKTL